MNGGSEIVSSSQLSSISNSSSSSSGSLVQDVNYWKEEAHKWEQISIKYLNEVTELKSRLAEYKSKYNSLLNSISGEEKEKLQASKSTPSSSTSSTPSSLQDKSISISKSNHTSSGSLQSTQGNPSSNLHSQSPNISTNQMSSPASLSSHIGGSSSGDLSASIDGKKKKKLTLFKFLEPKKGVKKDGADVETTTTTADQNVGGGFDYDEKGLSSHYHHLPKLPVLPLKTRNGRLTYARFTGPDYAPPTEINLVNGAPKTIYEASYSDSIYAISTSTYPHIKGKQGRDGDPIADRYNCVIYENRLITCLADGCNWGERPKEAAMKASEAFISHIIKMNDHMSDVKQVGKILFGAFEEAHNSIMKGKDEYWEAGTTTLLGGVLLQINKGDDKWTPEWEFVCASVGDCKAYVISNGEISDITEGNRHSLDPKDCGGRLGPHLEEGKPDLRNLNIFCASVNAGDVILLVTDGIYDNLDPTHLGKTPSDMSKEFNLVGSKWGDVDLTKASQAKTAFTTSLLENMLGDCLNSPTKISNKLIQHCWQLTEPSRVYLENNPGRLPQDYTKYPGKMDHTTCICFRVGQFEMAEERQALQSSNGSKDWVKTSPSANKLMSGSLGSLKRGDSLINSLGSEGSNSPLNTPISLQSFKPDISLIPGPSNSNNTTPSDQSPRSNDQI